MSRQRFPEDFHERRGLRGLWLPTDASACTEYSDGDAVELRLDEILEACSDRSAESAELRSRIVDWPTHYYFGAERANLFRALDMRGDATVLELGCGCGALTRWLGENAAQVTAIEGSARRAALARKRCEDLDNVQVVAGDFIETEWDRKFDVVTLIGVLEYAAMHRPDSADPFGDVLAAARRALAPGGVLVLAIENAVGVKYLAGCGEDHGLRAYAGVEGYPDGTGPRTFGREELQARIAAAGLPSIQCLLPFPDYKIPGTILNGDRADAAECRALSLTDWCRQNFEQYGGERAHAFSDHLALRSFAENGMLADVANSFLMLATESARTGASPLPPVDWVARKINVHRLPEYRTTVTLRRDGTGGGELEEHGKAQIYKTLAAPQSPNPAAPDPQLHHRPAAETPYWENAPTLSLRMLQALRQRQPREAFALCLRAWLEFLERSSEDGLASGHVAGSFLDCTPDNLLIREDAGLVYVDDEWHWQEPVSVDWLLYRGLVSFWHSHRPWVRDALAVEEIDSFYRKALDLLGFAVSPERMRAIRALERDLQARVHGERVEPEASETADSPIDPADDTASLRRMLSELRPESIRIEGAAPRSLVEALRRLGIEPVQGTEAELGLWFAEPPSSASDAFPPADPERCRSWIVCPTGECLDPSEASESSAPQLDGFTADERADVSFLAPRAQLFRRSALRITILSPSSELHGGTMVLVRHAQELAARGHRVWIASPSPKPPDWTELGDGVSYIPLPAKPIDWAAALPDADALVATLFTTAPVVRAAEARKGKKFYLVQAYESAWAGAPDDVDPTYRMGLHTLCVSSWLQELLLETYGVAAELVPNGTDFAGRSPVEPATATKADDAPLRIGMLCHLAPVKGTADGLQAFGKVQRSLGTRVELVLYGTERPTGIDASIEFHERPSRDRLAEMLRSLDVFVSPSLSEGFGLPALEAMALGTAVVLTDSGGCRDYAREGTALISPPGDPDALAANLMRVCRDAPLRRRLAANGPKVAAEFSWPNAAECMESALTRTIESASDPLHVLYVAAGPCWFDTYLDPWMLRAFRELGHEVTEFHPRPADARYRERFVNPSLLDPGRRRLLAEGAGKLPSELPAFVRKQRPDLVFINHGLLIPPTVLDTLRRQGVPTAAWMMDEPQEVYYSSNRGRLLDYVFLQDRGSLQRHRQQGNPRTFLLPHGVDPVDHRSRDDGSDLRPEFASDLLLIGTGFPARVELVRRLAGLDCDIRVIGRGWEEIRLPNVRVRNTPVTAEEAGHYYRGAKMTLNLHRGRNDMASGNDIPHPQSPNGSFFHISGCESLQLVDEGYPGASEYLVPGRQFAPFRDPEHLQQIVEFYLADEPARKRAAEDASWTLHRHYRYSDQLRGALEAIGEPRSNRRVYGLSQSALADRDVFDRTAAVPRVSVLLQVDGGDNAVQRSLLGIAAGHSEPNEILVYHDGSQNLDAWLDRRKIRHVLLEAPGPAGVVSDARARADGELLIYVHESAMVTAHLFRRLSTLFADDPSIGLIAPAIHPAGGDQAIDTEYGSLGELGRVSRELLLRHRGDFNEHTAPSGICFAVRREALDEAGGFDRRLPDATLEMADLCTRMQAAGWKTGWTRSALVHRLAPPPAAADSAMRRAEEILAAKRESASVGIPTLGAETASKD